MQDGLAVRTPLESIPLSAGADAVAARDILKSDNLMGANLDGLDLSGADLRGVNLSRASLKGTVLVGAQLQGAVLFEACLDDADLRTADLSGANLESARAERALLAGANLSGVMASGASLRSCSLTTANLQGAVFSGADLTGARLREVDARKACFTRANLQEADLFRMRLDRASFDDADMRGAELTDATGYRTASWLRVDQRNSNFTGAHLLRRWVLDENYLHEFRRQSRFSEVVYRAWSLTSDCGRSVSRWAMLVLVQVLVFGWLYTLGGVNLGPNPTWLSGTYFSVVTISSLGYGDILPVSDVMRMLAMIEVIMGYVMLGGMVSILSNKMARRAD